MSRSGKTRARSRQTEADETRAVAARRAVPGETEALLEEFQRLDAERETLRKELVDIDKKYTKDKLKPTQRDAEYRKRLVRAGQIRLRQTEIRSRLKELGRPLPPARSGAG